MIGPLLRVAASVAAARSLRLAAHDVTVRALMMLGAAAAVTAGTAFLTCAAFLLLERQVDPAAAWAILGAFWGIAGLVYFVAARRRRV